MKKLGMVFVMSFFLVVGAINSAGEEVDLELNEASTPSAWAMDEVALALEGGLVPEELRGAYQTDITRGEYVLLALEYLEDADVEVTIARKYPFSDIFGHEYEDEIVRAYNAGIVSGYPDGSYKPDDTISREEIATLMVNLLASVDESRDLNNSYYPVYSDSELVSTWARRYVDYCYLNGIMQGKGKDGQDFDVMDPKGFTSIEEAILLFTRLAIAEGVYESLPYGNISLVKTIGGNVEISSTDLINDFAKIAGEEVTQVFYDLQNKSYADMTFVSESTLEVTYNKDGSFLIYSDRGDQVFIDLWLSDLENYVMINAYKELLAMVENGSYAVDATSAYISSGSSRNISGDIAVDHIDMTIYTSYQDGALSEPVHIFDCKIVK